MKKSKEEARKEIDEFFSDIKNKTPKEIKKIKKLGMHYNIQLKDKRKKFCKKCNSPKLKTLNIKKGVKRVKCETCGFISRYKLG